MVKLQVANEMAAAEIPKRPMSGLAKSTARARTLVLSAIQVRAITGRKIAGYVLADDLEAQRLRRGVLAEGVGCDDLGGVAAGLQRLRSGKSALEADLVGTAAGTCPFWLALFCSRC